LIENHIPIKIFGGGWENKKYWENIKNNYVKGVFVGNEYVKIINSMDIALHFLRRGNRDEQDHRTFEIPACGTFMLAQFSDFHEKFKQANAADLFSNKMELLNKIKYYLKNKEERITIANNGYNYVRNMHYDYTFIMKELIDKAII